MTVPFLAGVAAVAAILFAGLYVAPAAPVFFGLLLPYLALAVFLFGVAYRILLWAASPVPFSVTLTGGQQRSLTWIRPAKYDAPDTLPAVWIRLLLEMFCFRSLLRNCRAEEHRVLTPPAGPNTEQQPLCSQPEISVEGPEPEAPLTLQSNRTASLFGSTRGAGASGPCRGSKGQSPLAERRLVYRPALLLWFAALVFHYAFFLILFRHLRFFLDPVPGCVAFAQHMDTLFPIGLPSVYITDALLPAALLFLLFRRLADEKLRRISLTGDYFPLMLLLCLALSGICLRYAHRTDLTAVKTFAMGLVTFSPTLPLTPEGTAALPPLFFLHLFCFCLLLIYFPAGKLMHAGGMLFSPARNLPNSSRRIRRVNPWNPPKAYRTYTEYEDEFRGVMREAGLPLENADAEAPRPENAP